MTGSVDLIYPDLAAINLQILEKQIEVFNAGGLEKLSIATVFDKEYPEAPNRSTVDEDVMKVLNLSSVAACLCYISLSEL